MGPLSVFLQINEGRSRKSLVRRSWDVRDGDGSSSCSLTQIENVRVGVRVVTVHNGL